ncbi:MAG: two-component system sensor histidine kinase NtrB [Aureliella sp.]
MLDSSLLEKKYERERLARIEAERTLESKSRELYESNEKLRRMVEAWRFENEKNQAILDHAAEGIIAFDSDGMITTFNVAAETIFGIPSFVATTKRFDELFENMDSESRFSVDAWLDCDVLPELIGKGPDGRDLVLDVGLSKTSCDHGEQTYIAIVHDRTKKKALETQLSLAQKMESVGQLAAGIAHEINTPIQYLGDNARFLQDAFDDIIGLLELYDRLAEVATDTAGGEPDRCVGLVGEIKRAKEEVDLAFLEDEIPQATQQTLDGTDRVAKIVRAMKEFSHPGSDEPTSVDINHSLETAVTVSRNEWKYVAEIEMDLASDLPQVHCFAGDLNQAFLNLVVNAGHAVQRRTEDEEIRAGEAPYEGKISVRTRKDGPSVSISFEDNGCGIKQEVMHRIFDPFFTTKPVGQGTGQGLALTHRFIVEKHGGTISVDSELGKGTTITLSLPIEAPVLAKV